MGTKRVDVVVRRHLATCLAACVIALGGGATASAQTLNSVPISRLQVRVRSCDVSNAQSTDRIYMRFGNMTFPFHPGWAGGRNAWTSYEIILPMVATSSKPLDTVGGIGASSLTIGKLGSDGWCINAVEVYLNGWVNDNGGPTVVDASALLSRVTFPNQWLDNSSGNSLLYTVNVASDTTNYVYKPYFEANYHSFGLWAIEEMLRAGYNHLTSQSGFLYGDPYTPSALGWKNLPTASNDSQWWSPFTFDTTVRPFVNGTSTPISTSLTSIGIAPTQATATAGPLVASGVTPTSSDFQSGVSSVIGAVNTMIRREVFPLTVMGGSTYVRTGVAGNTDYWLIALP